ncbi:MAG: ParB N-terminal domain-containing protein [Spirochaetia bacterium]|jgi:ParB family chromosome partitioning protein|nr:ParB N-terminal domain-containing protein [Spirochaetia bacterium]
MEVKIEDIIIKKRIRKNLGDLQPLMDSMSKFGQLNSIVLNSKMQLIAGQRRYESAKRLGWKYINAVIIEVNSKADLLEMEIEENIQRKDFNADEISDAYKKLSRLKSKNIFRRILQFLSEFFQKITFKFKKKRQNKNFK